MSMNRENKIKFHSICGELIVCFKFVCMNSLLIETLDVNDIFLEPNNKKKQWNEKRNKFETLGLHWDERNVIKKNLLN